MNVGLKYRSELSSTPFLVDELDNIVAGIRGAWNVEHTTLDGHGDITGYSLTLTKDSTLGHTGNIVAGGEISAAGDTHTFGGIVLSTSAAIGQYLIRTGGATDGLRFGRRVSSSPLSGYSFALLDLSKDSSLPIFQIGYYSAGSYFVLQPLASGGNPFALGFKDGTSSDRIKYISVQDGVYELARSVAMGYWQDYTPVWSATGVAPALGNGSISGRYTQVGDTVSYKIAITMGATTTFGTGAWLFTLPVTKRNDSWTSIGQTDWFASDASTGSGYIGEGVYNTTQVEPVYEPAPPLMNATLTSTTPFVWASGDFLIIHGSYEQA